MGNVLRQFNCEFNSSSFFQHELRLVFSIYFFCLILNTYVVYHFSRFIWPCSMYKYNNTTNVSHFIRPCSIHVQIWQCLFADTRRQTAPRSSPAKESAFLWGRYLQCALYLFAFHLKQISIVLICFCLGRALPCFSCTELQCTWKLTVQQTSEFEYIFSQNTTFSSLQTKKNYDLELKVFQM